MKKHGSFLKETANNKLPNATESTFNPQNYLTPGELLDLGRAMFQVTEHGNAGGPQDLLAGYTYLGQFIDHDITRLSISGSDPHPNPPTQIKNLETYQLDLSSLYGSGFSDPDLARVGDSAYLELSPVLDEDGRIHKDQLDDLPRKDNLEAKIPDLRNDENLLVAQLHVLFTKIHNQLVHSLGDEKSAEERFQIAKVTLISCYQRIVINDYLKNILLPEVWDYYFGSTESGMKFPVFWANKEKKRVIPLEFSGAVFRFGHGMVRTTYQLNQQIDDISLNDLFTLTGKGKLAENTHLPKKFLVNWDFFFKTSKAQKAFTIRPTVKINIPGEEWPFNLLTVRNLIRSYQLRLPTAQTLINQISKKLPKDCPLKKKLQPLEKNFLELPALYIERFMARPDELYKATPLWFYVLAEVSGYQAFLYAEDPCIEIKYTLGPLGSIVVAETFANILNAGKQECPASNLDEVNSMFDLINLFEKREIEWQI